MTSIASTDARSHMDTRLPGSVSLIQDLDKKLLCVLRDGRTLIGILRSVDQFANLLLHDTIERIHVGNQFGDIPRGVFLVRGENVLLLGEIVSYVMEMSRQDTVKEQTSTLEQVSVDEILEAQRVELETKHRLEEARNRAMKERGLCPHSDAYHDEY